jgi:hypothetical protein
VPVLLYHRVAATSFEEQMSRLRERGFEPITLEQYVRFVRGETVRLPRRPILITFDDGYASAWRSADTVLARYGWSAVMYVPTGLLGRRGHLTWRDLRQMHASGRWNVGEHGGDGHVLITADRAGRRLPFYAAKLWSNGTTESFADYKRRVIGDVVRGGALLAGNLTGWSPHVSFAVPFNNYGQNGSNDRRIAAWLSRWLKKRFAVVFVQRDDSFTRPGVAFANRIAVGSRWDADALESHLRRGLGPTQ